MSLVWVRVVVLGPSAGTEIGQGLYTKVAQAVAYKLGIDISLINITPTRTDSTPSLTFTGGSSTSEVMVKAAMTACDVILGRLQPFKTAQPTVCAHTLASACVCVVMTVTPSG